MVAPDTQKIMDLVEQKTGFGVSVLVDDKITTPAGMVSARSSVPMHLVKVNPKYEKYGEYLVALQCAMLLIKWGDPERIPDFGVIDKKVAYLKDKFAKEVSAKGMPFDTSRQYANMIVMGILQQLNSLPIQFISMDMIADWFIQQKQAESALNVASRFPHAPAKKRRLLKPISSQQAIPTTAPSGYNGKSKGVKVKLSQPSSVSRLKTRNYRNLPKH